MRQIYNVYCDESCHLEHDGQQVMVLGAVWCPLEKTREASVRLRETKRQHGLAPDFEVKWTKVSPARVDFYRDILDYFFDDDDLHFRALVIPDKSKLRHSDFNQTHDDFYYKMYFDMLKVIIDPRSAYRVYLDIKDTRGGEKIAKLHDVLCNNQLDFSRECIQRVQTIRSHESEVLQLTDLLIGAVGSANRGTAKSLAKQAMVERMRQRSQYVLTKSTMLRENKVNILIWHAAEGPQV